MNSTLLLIISIAVAVAGRYLDVRSSMYLQYYGGSEANKLWADADGNFIVWRNIAAFSVLSAVMLVVNFTLFPGVAVAFFIIGIASAIVAYLNNADSKKVRKLQIAVLSSLKAGEPTTMPTVLITRNGKSFFGLFRWVYSENPDLDAAEQEIVDRLYAIARLPQTEWFPH